MPDHRRIVVQLMMVVFFAAFAGWHDGSFAETPERVTIAYSKDLAPFHFSDDNGQPAGMIVDTWRLWSKKTGIAIDFRPAEWHDTLTLVGSGAADVHAGLFSVSASSISGGFDPL